MQAGEINIKFKVDSAGAITGIEGVSGALKKGEKTATEFNKGMINAAAILTVLQQGAGYASKALDELVIKPGQMAQNLKDLSLQTGIGTEKLQRLQYAAALSGTEFSSVSTALNQLTISMANASDKTSDAAQAFASLGINVQGKSPEEVFDEVARALSNVENETTRNQIAMEIYGRSWKDMIPYMDTYIENADKIRSHPVLSDEDLATLDEGKRKWDALTSTMDVYFNRLIVWLDKQTTKMNDLNKPLLQQLGLYQWLQGAGLIAEDITSTGEETPKTPTTITPQGETTTKKPTTSPTATQVEGWGLDLERLYQVSIPTKINEIKKLQDDYNKLANKSTDAAKELQLKLSAARLDLAEMGTGAQELADRLAAAGVSAEIIQAMVNGSWQGSSGGVTGSTTTPTSSVTTPQGANGGFSTAQMGADSEGTSPQIDPAVLKELADLRVQMVTARQQAAYYSGILAYAKTGDWQTAAQHGISWDPWKMPEYEAAYAEARGRIAAIETRYNGLLGMTGNYTGVPLAAGGIVTSPTRAIIGEAGPEAVIPLSNGGLPLQVTVNIDGEKVAEALTRTVNRKIGSRL